MQVKLSKDTNTQYHILNNVSFGKLAEFAKLWFWLTNIAAFVPKTRLLPPSWPDFEKALRANYWFCGFSKSYIVQTTVLQDAELAHTSL